MTQLTPTQQLAFDRLLQAQKTNSVLEINDSSEFGKTTILKSLQQHLGGELLQMYDLREHTRQQHPLALEECFEQVVMAALYHHLRSPTAYFQAAAEMVVSNKQHYAEAEQRSRQNGSRAAQHRGMDSFHQLFSQW